MSAPIHRTLSNGLELYLEPSDAAPLFSLKLLVAAGSQDEGLQHKGIFHCIEHSVFKGTKNFPMPGQIAAEAEQLGCDINAYTTYDHTAYTLSGPTEGLELGCQLLLDMVRHALIPAQEWEQESEVICEEIRQDKDQPGSILTHNLMDKLYRDTPIAWPIIGTKAHVQGFTQRDLLEVYHQWYTLPRMLLVAAGDFDPGALASFVEKLTCDAPSAQALGFSPRLPVALPPPLPSGPALAWHSGAFQEARVQLGFAIPGLEEEVAPTWDMLLQILGQHETSRLPFVVKDQKGLVTAIQAHAWLFSAPYGMGVVQWYGPTNSTLLAVSAVFEEFRRLAVEPPAQEELHRSVQQMRAGRLYGRESMEGMTSGAAAELLTAQKLGFEDRYLEALKKLTPGDISRYAGLLCQQIRAGDFAASVVVDQHQTDFTAEQFTEQLQRASHG